MVYRQATLADLEMLWDRNISENPEDARWLRWKQEFIGRNLRQEAVTFAVLDGDDPVGEVTLEYHKTGARAVLADGSTTGYVTALRIRPSYQGKGYVSSLVALMEDHARQRGIRTLTIGVEAAETRNLGIYLHWGYDRFLMAEEDDGALVLFYGKDLQ